MAAVESPPADVARSTDAAPGDLMVHGNQRASVGTQRDPLLGVGVEMPRSLGATGGERSYSESRGPTPQSTLFTASDEEFLCDYPAWTELLQLSPVYDDAPVPTAETDVASEDLQPTSDIPATETLTDRDDASSVVRSYNFSTLDLQALLSLGSLEIMGDIAVSTSVDAPSVSLSTTVDSVVTTAMPSLSVIVDTSGGSPDSRLSCPKCGSKYATARGLKKHTVMHHGLRYDPRGHELVPFGTEEDLERAVESCNRGQVRSERRKEKKRAAAAAASESVSQGDEPSEIKEASGEPEAVVTTEASIPEFSGAAEVKAATGGSPESLTPRPPSRPLNYELEDISDAENEPVDPFAVSFLEHHMLGRAPPLHARTVANLAVRGRVTPLPSQGDAPPPRSFLRPRCFAPAVRVTDPYYWPNESDWEYTAPPAANLRYAMPVTALSAPVVTPAINRPRVSLPPLVPPRRGPVNSEESRRTPLWHLETATANATSMRGIPPIMEAEPVRKLRRPPGGPQNSREREISTVSFTPTTD